MQRVSETNTQLSILNSDLQRRADSLEVVRRLDFFALMKSFLSSLSFLAVESVIYNLAKQRQDALSSDSCTIPTVCFTCGVTLLRRSPSMHRIKEYAYSPDRPGRVVKGDERGGRGSLLRSKQRTGLQ